MTDELKDKINEIANSKQNNSNIPEIKQDALSDVSERLQKMKDANDAVEREMLRAEELKAKLALGGRSFGGQPQVEIPQSEIDKEEAKRILAMIR